MFVKKWTAASFNWNTWTGMPKPINLDPDQKKQFGQNLLCLPFCSKVSQLGSKVGLLYFEDKYDKYKDFWAQLFKAA